MVLTVSAAGCMAEEEPPGLQPGSSASSAEPSALPSSAPETSEVPEPVETIGPDEVVPGCTDAQAEELGDVVGGVDVDGDGEKDVVRYVAGAEGAPPGEDCARTVVAYAPEGIAGFTLEAEVEPPSEATSLQPGGEGSAAYVSFRTTSPRGGYQQHLLALVGQAPDLRLVEVSADDAGTPLLPFVATDVTSTRAGFLCSDGTLVAQVGEPQPGGSGSSGTVWDVTTTAYAVTLEEDAAVASPTETTTQTGVSDDALEFGYPALLPESSARLCS